VALRRAVASCPRPCPWRAGTAGRGEADAAGQGAAWAWRADAEAFEENMVESETTDENGTVGRGARLFLRH
jgi:hypothetical protein